MPFWNILEGLASQIVSHILCIRRLISSLTQTANDTCHRRIFKALYSTVQYKSDNNREQGWGVGGVCTLPSESQNSKCQDLPKFQFSGGGGRVALF